MQDYHKEDVRGKKNMFPKTKKLVLRAKFLKKEKGICYVIHMGIKRIYNWSTGPVYYWYYKTLKSSDFFIFQGENYNYFYHKHHMTWKNERCVEIPIIWKFVKEYHGKNILEVGNVLSHYFNVNYDIVDKYEEAKGVINEDAVDFRPSKKYDVIVSISTLEHVGWDEKPKSPMKILLAIKNLKSLLAPKGKMIVTLPLGYNHDLDTLLKKCKIPFTKLFYLKRVSRKIWKEVDWDEVCTAKYNYPFSNANGLVIGIIEK